MIKIKSFLAHLKAIGVYNTLDYIIKRYLLKKSIISVKVKGVQHPVHLRRNSTDVNVFQQLFVNQDLSFLKGKNPRVIIDAGANIGLATVYIKSLFPEAEVFSIEPEESNYQMLLKNIKPYRNVTPIAKALSEDSNGVYLVDIGRGSDAFQTKKDKDEKSPVRKIESISINDLMKQYNLAHLDFVKIDIEGAEKDCLKEHAVEWIKATSLLAVEIHEHIVPGTDSQIKKLLKNFDFSVKGEYSIFTNPDFN